MSADTEDRLLYSEDGWSWAWIVSGPAFCVGAGLVEWLTRAPVHWLMLTVCGLATAVCHGVMVGATRIHGRVRLTAVSYTQGTEALPVSRIAEVLSAPVDIEGRFGTKACGAASWEMARTLGELREVPRRRTAVGLRLDSGAEVRAWARDAGALREALTPLVGRATSGPGMSGKANEVGQ